MEALALILASICVGTLFPVVGLWIAGIAVAVIVVGMLALYGALEYVYGIALTAAIWWRWGR